MPRGRSPGAGASFSYSSKSEDDFKSVEADENKDGLSLGCDLVGILRRFGSILIREILYAIFVFAACCVPLGALLWWSSPPPRAGGVGSAYASLPFMLTVSGYTALAFAVLRLLHLIGFFALSGGLLEAGQFLVLTRLAAAYAAGVYANACGGQGCCLTSSTAVCATAAAWDAQIAFAAALFWGAYAAWSCVSLGKVLTAMEARNVTFTALVKRVAIVATLALGGATGGGDVFLLNQINSRGLQAILSRWQSSSVFAWPLMYAVEVAQPFTTFMAWGTDALFSRLSPFLVGTAWEGFKPIDALQAQLVSLFAAVNEYITSFSAMFWFAPKSVSPLAFLEWARGLFARVTSVAAEAASGGTAAPHDGIPAACAASFDMATFVCMVLMALAVSYGALSTFRSWRRSVIVDVQRAFLLADDARAHEHDD